MAIVMLIPTDIDQLVNFFSFTAWLWYGAVALSLVVLRWTRPNLPRHYKVGLTLFNNVRVNVGLFVSTSSNWCYTTEPRPRNMNK